MKKSHLNIKSKFNEYEGKSDVLVPEKSYEPVYEKCDLLENEKNGPPKNEYIDESKCDMRENMNIFHSNEDGNPEFILSHLIPVKSEPLDFDTHSGCNERINDKTDVSEDEIGDSKFFVQQYSDEENKLRDSKDTMSSKRIGNTKCSQHTLVSSELQVISDAERNLSELEAEDSKCFIYQYLNEEGKLCNNIDTVSLKKEENPEFIPSHLNPVKSEPSDFDTHSGCDKRINDKTDVSEDEIEDSKFFGQQYLDKEEKFVDSKDAISSSRIGNTKCSQHTLVSSELQVISDVETNLTGLEAEDSKCFIYQYLDEEGKLCNNIDTVSLKKEDTDDNLQPHIDTEHPKVEKRRCHLSRCKLECHNHSVHLKEKNVKTHKCQLCDYETSRRDHLNRHIDSVHLKVKKYSCDLCDYSSTSISNLKCHIDNVHLKVTREKKHKCHLCPYSNAYSSNLNRHIDSVHLNVKREKKHKCHLCDYSSTFISNLKCHIDNVHLKVMRKKEHKCHLCHYSNAYLCNLNSHINNVHLKVKREKIHKCHLCDYSSTCSTNLKCHIDNDHLNVKREKKHKCHLCNYSAAYSSSLKSHIDNVHLKVKKHKCHLCDYSSTFSGNLKCHIDSVHLKLKKHKCHLCDYCAVKSNDLNRHVDIVHRKVMRNKKHKCHLCDYSTSQKGQLERHIDGVHLKVKKHKCNLCDYSTSQKCLLKRHNNSVHLKLTKD